jgi:hypothetical protein
MNVGVISDIHGDYAALETALDRLRNIHRVDLILCAGDLVGRGPQPDSVVELIRQYNIPTVRGNHDEFNYGLTPENKAFLRTLPLEWRGTLEGQLVYMTHGKPGNNLWGLYRDHVSNTLLNMMLDSLMAGRPARWLGNPDAPHEFVFVPDAARVIADLLGRPDCFGRRWNLAGPGLISGREFAALAARELGAAPRLLPTGPLLLRLGGLFNPLLRELVELQYLGVTPVLLDDSALDRALGGIRKTPYAEGIQQMIAWMRNSHA